MKKIIIIGSPGAGKSTLSIKLQEILGFDLYHLDKLFWKAGWVMEDKAIFIQKQEDVIQKDSWIIDGNYGGTMNSRIAKADTILFLDFPRYKCIWRVLKRSLFNKSRTDMAKGCEERLDWEFLKFLKYIFDFKKIQLGAIYKRLKNLDNLKEVFIFRNDKDLEVFLKRIKEEK